MIKYENDCVGCERCVNCGRKHTMHVYCDNCEQESEELYEFGGMEICLDCLLELVPKVDIERKNNYG